MTASEPINDAPERLPLPDFDLSLVRKMQTAMQPHHLPSSEEFELGMRCFPGEKLGGDLFDFIRITDDVMAFLMVDVAAPGPQAVMTAAMVKLCITDHIRQKVSPFAVIERVNKELLRDIGAELGIAAFVGYLDLHDNEFAYCNAGFSGTLIFRRRGETIEQLASHGTGIGRTPRGIGGEDRVHLAQGDCLVLFTDGLYRLFDMIIPAVERAQAGAFIRSVLLKSSASSLVTRIERQYAACTSRCTIEDDLTIMYVEMLTRSRKEQIKEKLGFGVSEVVYLQFLNYLEEMDRTASAILSAMDVAGFPDDMIRKMKIVLAELLVNAIVHGNKRDSMKRVVVGHNIDRQRAVISIMDEGEGFEPKIIPDPTLPENLDKPCGRGLFIVRHYVDSIAFNKAGNRVTITKNNVI